MNNIIVSDIYDLIHHNFDVQWLCDRKRAKTKIRIIEAAIYLLATRSWEGITTGQITKLVGISQPSFYSHHESLEACLDVVIQVLMQPARRIEDTLEEILGAYHHVSAFKATQDHFEQLLAQFEVHPNFLVMFFETRRQRNTLGATLMAFESNLTNLFKAQTIQSVEADGFDTDLLAPQIQMFASAMCVIFFSLLEQFLNNQISRAMCIKLMSSQNIALRAYLFSGRVAQI